MLAVGESTTAIDAAAWQRCMSLLHRCNSTKHLRAVHALFLHHGLHHNTFALSRLIHAFCSLPSSENLHYASLLFHQSPATPNSFIFNTLIRAHSRGPHPAVALNFFTLLPFPDHHSYPFALAACARNICLFSHGKQIHARVFSNGLASADRFVQTALLRFYGCNDYAAARKVFDEIPLRDAVHYDVLMNAYINNDMSLEAVQLFRRMILFDFVRPDEFVITTALTACAHASALEQGEWVNRYLELERPEFLSDSHVGSALVSMYAKCGCIENAKKVFNAVAERNSYVWSAMVGGYAMNGLANESVKCLARMQDEDGLQPDGVVVLNVLSACSHAGLVEEGTSLLASMEMRYGVVPQHEHYSCAVDMLCRVGRLEEAVALVHQMPMKPLASVWGSLLTGCRLHGNVELAEFAVEELQSINADEGDDEGAYVQLSNIYLNANRKEDASRVRKLIGSRGIKKTAYSAVEVEGKVSSFVSGDLVHPQRMEIGNMLQLLLYGICEKSYFFKENENLEPLFLGCT